MRYILICVLWALAMTASMVRADGIAWDLQPELGAGTTFLHQQQVSVSLGLRLGTLPNDLPLLAGREFGVDLLQVGGLTAGGVWIGLTDVAGVEVRLGALVMRDEEFDGDLYARIARTFEIAF
ncbi:MAG: hypothetical protein GYA36_21180 [Veillonellaceae bacterium]|nr:hypothetical protein [Veillonellaceae bacterium]